MPDFRNLEITMKWNEFCTLADQYESATKELLRITARLLAGDMGAADPNVLARSNSAHVAFVTAAEDVFANVNAGTSKPSADR
jgi:hypothetical protein